MDSVSKDLCVQYNETHLSCVNRLGSHLSPSGTECYITSDMFYVEVQLDASGQLVDVKVAHQGENPTVSLLYLPYVSIKLGQVNSCLL